MSWNPNSPCFYINVGSSNKGYWEGTSAISDIISDTLVATSYNVVRNTGNPYYVAFTGQGGSIEWTSASVDLTAEKARLSSTPINLIYRLATPVTYTLSSVTVPSTVQGENNWWHDANGNITIEAIGTPISSDEPDALQALNILLGGAYTPRANFSEPTDEQALNIIMGGSR